MRNSFLVVFLFSLITLLACDVRRVEQEPTLEESLEWLEKYLEQEFPAGNDGNRYTISAKKVEPCVLLVTVTTQTVTGDHRIPHRIPLSALAVNGIVAVPEYRIIKTLPAVQLRTRMKSNSIETLALGVSEPRSILELPMEDFEIARRIAAAFRAAAKACGARTEPF